MGFFSSKEEVKLDDFCRHFYGDLTLNPLGGKIDGMGAFAEVVKKTITEVFPEFSKINTEKLKEELTILKFELFALAWIHKFGVESAIEQSIFTKKYLHENGRDDIWEGMAHYNGAIAHSVHVQAGNNKVYIIKERVDLFEKYVDASDNKEAPKDDLALALNRISSEKASKTGDTNGYLMLALCSKLGLGSGKDYYGPPKEASTQLQYIIRGMYEGAKETLENIKIKK